ncbi:MAG: hypothetical protein IPK72_19525 [Candidatus Eisenbacteria bacterium]|nr:hypothetical protein [Candidatus Eisenbacteria bacterium]
MKSGLMLSYRASSDAAIIATVDRLARIFGRESRGVRGSRDALGKREQQSANRADRGGIIDDQAGSHATRGRKMRANGAMQERG